MITVPDELVIAGVARAMAAWLREPETGERVARHLAEAQRSEVMTTAEAAELLRCSTKTLLANHVEWQITKSVALGEDNPRFYRSQIMERMRAKEIKGRKDGDGKVTTFPQDDRKQKAS